MNHRLCITSGCGAFAQAVNHSWPANRPEWTQKNRFESRNGRRATTKKRRNKIGKTDGAQDLLVFSQAAIQKGPALHQVVFGLKHDAKLWNHFAGQPLDNVKFLLTFILNIFSHIVLCECEEIAGISSCFGIEIYFLRKSYRLRCTYWVL